MKIIQNVISSCTEKKEPDSLVGISIGYGLDVRGSIPSKSEIFF
jgi:hypothetical protein